MAIGYVRRKDKTDLLAKWQLSVPGGLRLHCYVWSSVEGVEAAIGEEPWTERGKQTLGAYIGIPRRKDTETGAETRGPLFGEFHFTTVRIGVGIVAHEVQHFMVDWMRSFCQKIEEELDSAERREVLCWLAGEVTRRFWVGFYKRFKRFAEGG